MTARRPPWRNTPRDVTTFLMWAAEPHMEARKRLGMQVFVFLILFAGLLYFTKKKSGPTRTECGPWMTSI